MTDRDSQSRRETLALIGLRGSGKTTVGRVLAEMLNGHCVDADDVIQRETGNTIAELFEREGEAGFRRREREAIAKIVQAPPEVLSVGGGAVLDDSTAKALGDVATIVWLTAPAGVLWQRISTDPTTSASRPSLTDLDGVEELEQLAGERSATYQRVSDFVVQTEGLTTRQVAQAIIDLLNKGRED